MFRNSLNTSVFNHENIIPFSLCDPKDMDDPYRNIDEQIPSRPYHILNRQALLKLSCESHLQNS